MLLLSFLRRSDDCSICNGTTDLAVAFALSVLFAIMSSRFINFSESGIVYISHFPETVN